MTRTTLITLILMLTFSVKLYAQSPCNPDEDPCDPDDWEIHTFDYPLLPDCKVTVRVEKRICEETTQFRWEIYEKEPEPNNCDQYDLERIVDGQILNSFLENDELDDVPICDPEDEDAFKRTQKYTNRSCIFRNSCSDVFELKEPLECQDGTTWGNEGDETSCGVIKNIDGCGVSCCKDEFKICKSEETQQIIIEDARQRSVVSECSDPPKNDDGDEMDPSKCSSCQNPPR